MWIRSQNKELLIDCNKIEISTSIDTVRLNKMIKESLKQAQRPLKWAFKTKIPHLISNRYVDDVRVAKITENEYIELMGEKHRENYRLFHLVNRNYTLGTYSTKERVLEVLDEIEKHIIGKIILPTTMTKHNFENTTSLNVIECNSEIQSLPTVYEMPLE